MDRLIQMILRRVVMRLVSRGVDAGMNRMTRPRSRTPQTGQNRQTVQNGSDEPPIR